MKTECETCKHKQYCNRMDRTGSCIAYEPERVVQNTIELMLHKFGEDTQIDVAIEEMSELIKELIKYKRSKIHFREKQAASREHVLEEIGDVMFMMEYLKRIFNLSQADIERIVEQKAERTKERYIDGE